jgi:hypothetical protein
VENGFLHSVACIMAAQSYWQGKRVYDDPKSEEIKSRAPPHSESSRSEARLIL